jgi:hypothetical protein
MDTVNLKKLMEVEVKGNVSAENFKQVCSFGEILLMAGI